MLHVRFLMPPFLLAECEFPALTRSIVHSTASDRFPPFLKVRDGVCRANCCVCQLYCLRIFEE